MKVNGPFKNILPSISDLLLKFNGPLKVGIAAGVDPDLDQDMRFRLNKPDVEGRNYDAIVVMGALEGLRVGDLLNVTQTDQDKMMMAAFGIAAVAGAFLHFYEDTDEPCSDFILGHFFGLNEIVAGTSDHKAANKRFLNERINDIMIKVERAKMVLVATKISMYLCNHHVGQVQTIHYANFSVRKYWQELDPQGQIDGKKALAMVKTAGHWVGTVPILTKLGYLGMRPTVSAVHIDGRSIKEIEYKKMRINSPPAGTSKHYISAKGAEQMMHHVLFLSMPHHEPVALNVKQIKVLMSKDLIPQPEAAVVNHHLGYYLGSETNNRDVDQDAVYYWPEMMLIRHHPKSFEWTGKAQVALDHPSCIGVTGPMIFHLQLHRYNTLFRSPHVSTRDRNSPNTRIPSYTTDPHYSVVWEELCRQAASTLSKRPKDEFMAKLRATGTSASNREDRYLKLALQEAELKPAERFQNYEAERQKNRAKAATQAAPGPAKGASGHR
jgi:hypothetical protein